jgi:glutamyl/glutaminyl-tRNA synthetase
MISRFAPTTSGRAHLGTLLAGLLAWLDARAHGHRLLLRLEDLDPERCRDAHADGLLDDFTWLGLEWDACVRSSAHAAAHAQALDHLAAGGHLYPSARSRRELAASARRAPDGAWWYDNGERSCALPAAGWRAATVALRCRLPAETIELRDGSGLDLSQDPASAAGDPVVRRRDGVVAYALAVVVDDGLAGVDRVVRGRDIAPGTATQVALQRLLGLPTPAYHHHLLVLEADGAGKLSKSHGAVAAPTLRRHLSAAQVCGFLAWCAGLIPRPEPCHPSELLPGFAWSRVRRDDVAVRWDGARLHRLGGDATDA